MAKAFGAIFLITTCGIIGWVLTFELQNKLLFFQEWKRFNYLFLSALSARRMSIPKFLDSFEASNPFSDFLNVYRVDYTITKSPKFLNQDERKFLLEYFTFIGKTDVVGQVAYLQEKDKVLKQNVDKVKEEYQKKLTVYPKLGLLAGVMIVVLLL